MLPLLFRGDRALGVNAGDLSGVDGVLRLDLYKKNKLSYVPT